MSAGGRYAQPAGMSEIAMLEDCVTGCGLQHLALSGLHASDTHTQE